MSGHETRQYLDRDAWPGQIVWTLSARVFSPFGAHLLPQLHHNGLDTCKFSNVPEILLNFLSWFPTDYDMLFQLLELVKGSVEVRRAFVQDIVSEATKFKRKPLIQRLEEWGARLGSLGKGAGRGKAASSQKR